jgi:hypothetical protein
MEIKKIELSHVGALLKKYAKEKRVFQSAWARAQGIKPKTVISYYKRPSMQLSTLFTICQVLKYNFVREIADALPAEFPPHTPNPLATENDALKKEIEFLKREIEILERVAGVKRQG